MSTPKPVPETHALVLELDEAKAVYLAIQIAGVSRTFGKDADSHTLFLFDKLSARLRAMIPEIEGAENKLARRAGAPIAPNRRVHICATEHCCNVVSAAGENCDECQGPGAA